MTIGWQKWQKMESRHFQIIWTSKMLARKLDIDIAEEEALDKTWNVLL